jgi:cell division septation protein DedD
MRYSCKLRRTIGILVGVSVAAISLWLTAWPASAQDTKPETAISDAPQVPKAKPAQSSYKPYFVEFRARFAASYGHMYVLYGQVNGRGEIVKSDIAGLHPAGDANNCDNCSLAAWTLGHIFFVPAETGASDGDLEEKYVTARYRVMVDAATFKKVSEHIRKLKAEKPMWNAFMRNCVLFGNDIAGNVGLKTPGFLLLEPKYYVEQLRELNGGKPQGPLKFAASSSAKTSVSTPPVVSTSSGSVTPGTSSVPRKPKKQPMANLPAAQAAGLTSGTPH